MIAAQLLHFYHCGPHVFSCWIFAGLLPSRDGGSVWLEPGSPSGVAAAGDDIITNGLLGLGPTAVAANSSLDNVDLFTIQLLGSRGSYAGNQFQLIRGTDPIACSFGTVGCNTDLGNASFLFEATSSTPVAVPEQGGLLLLLPSALVIGAGLVISLRGSATQNG